MRKHGLDDRGQRLDRGDVAVQQAEGLTVVGADTDFEQHALGGSGAWWRRDVDVAQLGEVADRRRVDDAAHFEPTHLADHHTVLDVHRCASGFDDVDEFEMRRQWGGRRCERFGDHREQQPILRVPDGDRESEALGPTGEQAGVVFDHQLQ